MELICPDEDNFPWSKKFQVTMNYKEGGTLGSLVGQYFRLDGLRAAVEQMERLETSQEGEGGRRYDLNHLYIRGSNKEGFFLGLRVKQGRENFYIKVGTLSFVKDS